jgi:tetratricopeptide (TPR) repeat protein
VAAVLAPWNTSFCDAFPVTAPTSPRALVGAALLVALAAYAWRRRGPAWLMALSLLPALQLVPVARWWSPHYVYTALGFGALLAAEAIAIRAERWLTASYAIVAALAGLSLYDGLRYETDRTLWTYELAHNGMCREAHFYLGEADREHGEPSSASHHYEAAIKTSPRELAFVDRGAALQNLGTVRVELRDLKGARQAFSEALSGTGEEATRREITHNLAAVTLQLGDAAEADRLLAPETARADALPQSIMVRALALKALGRIDEARALAARAATAQSR